VRPDARVVNAPATFLEEDSNGWLVTFSDLVLQLFAFVMVAAALGTGTGPVPEPPAATAAVERPAFAMPVPARMAELERMPAIGPDALSLARFDELPRADARAPEPKALPAIVMVEVPAALETKVEVAAAPPAPAAPIRSLASELESYIAEAGFGEAVQVALSGGGVTLSISDTIGFASGSADLLPDAASVLDEIRGLIVARPDLVVEVAGHTDDRPVHGGAFASNLDLSLARAARVARELAAGDDLLASRIFAAGYGPQRPIADNGNVDGRARNRRVELKLVPASAAAGAEPPLVRDARHGATRRTPERG
jgi:flagellar motor protein MotB